MSSQKITASVGNKTKFLAKTMCSKKKKKKKNQSYQPKTSAPLFFSSDNH